MNKYQKMFSAVAKVKKEISDLCASFKEDHEAVEAALEEITQHVNKLGTDNKAISMFRGGPDDR